MHRLLQTVFWIAIAVTLYFTLRPPTMMVPGSDKIQHAVTFGMLMLLAAAAHPGAKLVALGAALSGVGGAIELVQPLAGRSDDLLDWIADTIGIVAALALIWVMRKAFLSRNLPR